jgi:hypothetical protein
MPELVANCPRCGSRHITFDVTAAKPYRQDHGWQYWYGLSVSAGIAAEQQYLS